MAEHVIAEHYDEAGKLLWTDDPYPFRRMFAVGQELCHGRKRYCVVSKKFEGIFGNGKITYVVKP